MSMIGSSGGRLGWALFAVLAAVSCGSDDGSESGSVTEENFRAKLLAALCDIAPCCGARQLVFDAGGCKAHWSEVIEQMGDPSAGQAFDPKVAAECLTKIGAVTDACRGPDLGLSGSCTRVWHAEAGPAESCNGVGDCTIQAGALASCSGQCGHVTRGTQGASCQASCTLAPGETDRIDVCFDSSSMLTEVDPAGAAVCLLDEGLECVADAGGAATCTAIEGWVGSACTSAVDCAVGHFCAEAKTCTPQAQAGKDLDGYGSACVLGADCTEPYVCVEEPHDGSSGGRCALKWDVTALDCSGAATTVVH